MGSDALSCPACESLSCCPWAWDEAVERRELQAEVRNSIGAFEVKLRATQRDLKHQDDDDDDD